MAAKKKMVRAVRTPATAALYSHETTILLDQPGKKDVHAGEEVDVVDDPSTTPSTSMDKEAAADTRRESNLEQNEFLISPYACSPVAIDVGPGLATYSVPKHLLRSPRWSTTESGGTLCLPGVSAPTGHTLVHYLYTGTYQTLEAKGEEAVVPAQTEFKQALWTFVFASAYELHDLERLAKEQIETHGSRMAFVELLDTSKQEFSKMTWCWFHDYLQARARKEFDLDYTIFTSEAFMESAGEGKLLKFMTCLLLEMFSEKLAQTMQTKESPCLDKARPRAVLNEVEKAAVNAHHYPCYQGEHQPDMCTASDETSFDSLDVSCEQADDMISLKSSEWNEVSPTPPELEPVPAPEADPPAESVSEPGPVLDSSPTKEAEYTDRKKEEEVEVQAPAVATTSAATSAANNFNWVERTLGNVDWGSFTAPTTRGKKKKGKKGKAKPTPPPPPPPPAGPPTTFDDIIPDDVKLDDSAPKIDMNSGDSGAAKSGSGLLGSLGGRSPGRGSSIKTPSWGLADSSKDAAKEADNPWDSADKKEKDANGFYFDFDAFKGTTDAAPAATEKLMDGDGWGSAAPVVKKKKGKKGALIEEPIPEPEPTPAPEPRKKEEDDPWAFTFGATKDKKKKKKGFVEEAPPPPRPEPEPEPVIEPEPTSPAEEKRSEGWADWGAAAAPVKKSKKKKKGAMDEEPPPPPPEPEVLPEPEPEPVPESEPTKDDNEGGDWGFSPIWGGGKKKKKGKNDPEPPPEPEPSFPEPLVIESAVQEPDAVEEAKAEDDDEWGMKTSWGKKKKDPKKGALVEVTEDTTTPVQKPDEDDPWGSAAFNSRKMKKSREGALIPDLASPPPKMEPELPPMKEIEAAPPAEDGDMWLPQGLPAATTKRGEVVEESLTNTTSEESSKSAKDVVEDLISLDDPPPVEEKKEKNKKKISSVLSVFGGGTVEPSSKKETATDKRVRERRERKKREEQERMYKENALNKEEEERITREAEGTGAEAARIAEKEAESARIVEEEAETARIAAEEEEKKKKEEEEAVFKSRGRWAASLWGSSKKKESTNEKKAREKREAEETDETAAAAEQAQREAEEAEAAKAEAARVAAEEATLRASVSSKEKKKKKGGVVIEEPTALPSPPPASEDPDADLSDLFKDMPQDQLLAELREDLKTGPMPETSSTLCPRRSHHLLGGDSWKSCERCCAMLREIAVQLARENKTVLLLE